MRGIAEEQAYATGVEAERERCAKLVEGDVYKERYRTWPGVGDGDRDGKSELARHCDALAALIRAG